MAGGATTAAMISQNPMGTKGLLITFRDRTPGKNSPTEGDWVAWVGRYSDLVEGAEGQYRLRLMDNKKGWDTCYPGLELLPCGTFVTTTYGNGPVEMTTRTTRRLLDSLGCDDVVTLRGASDPDDAPATNQAARRLKEIVAEEPGQIVLVSREHPGQVAHQVLERLHPPPPVSPALFRPRAMPR